MDEMDDNSKSSSINEEDNIRNIEIDDCVRHFQTVYGLANLSIRTVVRKQLNYVHQLQPISEGISGKSAVLATEMKKLGDESFCVANYEKAASLYTLCLSLAPEGSEDMGHAYANRSASLFKLGKYEQGLLDIDRALASNYPEDKKQKLRERKERFLLSWKRDANDERAPSPAGKKAKKLSSGTEDDKDDGENEYTKEQNRKSLMEDIEVEWRELCNFKPPNPLLPNASAKIKLECNEKWGRHIVTTEDVRAGELLSSQNVFLMLLEFDNKYKLCAYCTVLCFALIPCPSCNLAMYCSEHCLVTAFNSYHRIECQLFSSKEVRDSIGGIDRHTALRMLLVGTEQGAGLATLMKKLTLSHIFAEKVDPTNKPFSADYVSVLRLRRTFNELTGFRSKSAFIMRIIVALQEVGYFDSDPERQNVGPKDESHLDAKDADKNVEHGTDGEDSDKLPNSNGSVDESKDKKEDADTNEDEDKKILKENWISPTIVGNEFIKKVTCHYCELCRLCLCYNPEVSQDEVLRAHCRTPLHLERCSSENSREQVQKYSTDTAPSPDVNSCRTDKEPLLNSTSESGPSLWTTKTPQDFFAAYSNGPINGHSVTESREYVTDTALFKNVKLCKTIENPPFNVTPKPEFSTTTVGAPEDVAKDSNQENALELRTQLTEMELFVAFLLLNHVNSVVGNTVPLLQLFDQSRTQKIFGVAVCPLHNMANHSCDPNAFFVFRNREHALVSSRMIPKGEQVFISYTPGYWHSPLDVRIEKLSVSGHRFVCECTACVNSWPTFDILQKDKPKFSNTNLKTAKRVFNKVMLPITRHKMSSMSRREVIQVISRISKWLLMNLEMPSTPLIYCECILVRAFKHFYDNSAPESIITEVAQKEELEQMLIGMVTLMGTW